MKRKISTHVIKFIDQDNWGNIAGILKRN
jgi:hypothetical protein